MKPPVGRLKRLFAAELKKLLAPGRMKLFAAGPRMPEALQLLVT
jgi:hypothetical protein